MPSRLGEFPGEAPTRNVILGVMSGGRRELLMGMASPLSQTVVDTRFRQLYEGTCAVAREYHNVESACLGINKYGIKIPFHRT